MKIEFFSKTTGQVLDGNKYGFFVMNDVVYRYHSGTYQSQPQLIQFDDFIELWDDIDWRVLD